MADRPVAAGVVPTQAQFAADALRWRWRPITAAHAATRQQPCARPGSPRVPLLACGCGGRGGQRRRGGRVACRLLQPDGMRIELYLRVRAWEAGSRSPAEKAVLRSARG